MTYTEKKEISHVRSRAYSLLSIEVYTFEDGAVVLLLVVLVLLVCISSQRQCISMANELIRGTLVGKRMATS
jgi:hypothetical protein